MSRNRRKGRSDAGEPGLVAPVGMRLCALALTLSVAWLLAPMSATGQDVADIDYEYLAFRGFGFDVGYLWPDRLENTPSYGIRFDFGYAGPGLRVLPSVTYWSADLEGGEVVEFQDRIADLVAAQTGGPRPDLDLGSINYRDVAVGVDAQVVWEVPFDVLTYGGLGVAAHFINGDGDAIDGTFVEDLIDSVDPGFNLHVGAEYPVTEKMRLYTVGRYELMPDVRYFQVRVGWQFMTGPNAPGEGRGND